MTMNVKELMELLSELPEDHPVYLRGYANGSVFYEPLEQHKFLVCEREDTGEEVVEVAADWN